MSNIKPLTETFHGRKKADSDMKFSFTNNANTIITEISQIN